VIGHSFGGMLATHLAATAPERVGRMVLLDPVAAQSGAEMLEAAEETRLDEGWATWEEAHRARTEGRPPAAVPFAEEDLEVALEQGEDGRYRMRFCRSAAVTAWSEMARAPVSLAGWGGEALLVPALRDDMVSRALVEALRRDLGNRLTEHGIDAGHVLYWDAFGEVAELLRRFLLPDRAAADPVVRSSAS
jgi:lipase